VGKNGDGKSTLLRLFSRMQEPDAGQITKRSDVHIGMLDQIDDFLPDQTISQVVVGDLAEHEWAGNPKVRDIFAGLLADFDFDQKVSELSGGQRRRVALAALLAKEWDILMLDEPTNHLDIEGVAWLANHLKMRWGKASGGLLLVTHDRWFLDEVCNLTWEVHDGVVDVYDGGYASYILERNERSRSQAASESRRQNLLRKELAWLRRGAPARTTKPKFRIDAANELIANEPPPRDSVNLAKLATTRLGKDVLDIEHLSYSVPGRELLVDITLRLGPGDRIGLLGANGTGKTTLMKLILGLISPDSGRVKRGKTVVPAILSQEVRELDEFADQRIFELIAREKRTFVVDKKEVGISQLVEQLGFTSLQLQTPIGDLSGGQRRRLQLLRLLFGEPNLLILDEPTNDLDTDMLAQVEDLLDSWPGTLIVVSHDRYLLERVTDMQYALLGDGALRHLPRGVEQYLELRKSAGGKASASQTTTSSGAKDRASQKNLQRLERSIAKTEAEELQIKSDLEKHDPADYEGLANLASRAKQLSAKREELEASWLAESENQA
ncbi:MAG: ATP-binding cassette domain-containing protein, partial [Actinobacteria bacterium]|nr:ATP-binding cassette domain-containing protein [Actinomycetota bacterium]